MAGMANQRAAVGRKGAQELRARSQARRCGVSSCHGATIWLHTTPHLQFEDDRFRPILGRSAGILNRRQLRPL